MQTKAYRQTDRQADRQTDRHTYMRTLIYTHTHACTHMHMYAQTLTHTHTCTHICANATTHTQIYRFADLKDKPSVKKCDCRAACQKHERKVVVCCSTLLYLQQTLKEKKCVHIFSYLDMSA